MRTAEEFKKSALENRIDFWHIRNCAMCDYPLGYIICLENDSVKFDCGCYCVTYKRKQDSSWQDIAYFYNSQSNNAVIAKFNEFWRFENVSNIQA